MPLIHVCVLRVSRELSRYEHARWCTALRYFWHTMCLVCRALSVDVYTLAPTHHTIHPVYGACWHARTRPPNYPRINTPTHKTYSLSLSPSLFLSLSFSPSLSFSLSLSLSLSLYFSLSSLSLSLSVMTPSRTAHEPGTCCHTWHTQVRIYILILIFCYLLLSLTTRKWYTYICMHVCVYIYVCMYVYMYIYT
jgi:hypothetical protein